MGVKRGCQRRPLARDPAAHAWFSRASRATPRNKAFSLPQSEVSPGSPQQLGPAEGHSSSAGKVDSAAATPGQVRGQLPAAPGQEPDAHIKVGQTVRAARGQRTRLSSRAAGNSVPGQPSRLILGLPRLHLGSQGLGLSLILGRHLGAEAQAGALVLARAARVPGRPGARQGCGAGAELRALPGRTERSGRSRPAARTGGSAAAWTCR